MERLRSFLSDPLAHFLALGLGIFLVYFAVSPDDQFNDDPRKIVVDRDALLTFIQYRTRTFQPELAEQRLAWVLEYKGDAPLIVSLLDSDLECMHAVAVYCDEYNRMVISDSDEREVLPLTRAGLDRCCGVDLTAKGIMEVKKMVPRIGGKRALRRKAARASKRGRRRPRIPTE